ncbi:HNH endonuclease [Paraburkholderia sediminicola]|uniref:HNH endonuclease n=1 Tax=Paraburkholderia sediminicola TaxID=458836 RepID=UPI0038BB109E
MAYHVFNIGKPATTAWWQQNLERAVITAGFEAEMGDRGDEILHDMHEGDWILAYCNGHGFVGAGVVGPIDSYQLHTTLPTGSLSDHHHERRIAWKYVVDDVGDAVTVAESGRHAPRQTKEQERNEAIAKDIIVRLAERREMKAARSSIESKASKYWHVLEAVRAIGPSCSVREVRDWLEVRYPDEDNSDARENVTLLTVNDANRRHYDPRRGDFKTDQGNPKDALYREGRSKNVTYMLYRPIDHGVWDIEKDGTGVFQAVKIPTRPMHLALADAQMLVATQPQEPITSDHDGRVRELRAVVLREGQGEFRTSLLDAYGYRCAMTGCAVVEILEAAHIRPYRGTGTNRSDNGLLLRADIHTLFDKGLLWLEDRLVIRVSDRLRGSEYESLDGTKLRVPADPVHQPHIEHVAHHRRAALGELRAL